MTNHPGDYHSFLHLARMREEHLERKSRQHKLLKQAPARPGMRTSFAGFLRTVADRLEAPRPTTDPKATTRYQRAP